MLSPKSGGAYTANPLAPPSPTSPSGTAYASPTLRQSHVEVVIDDGKPRYRDDVLLQEGEAVVVQEQGAGDAFDRLRQTSDVKEMAAIQDEVLATAKASGKAALQRYESSLVEK